MAEKKVASVPYTVYEAEQIRNAKLVRMLWIVIIILIVSLVGTNLAWVIYESQFEYVTETIEEVTVTQDNESGDNNYIGHDGDINNG